MQHSGGRGVGRKKSSKGSGVRVIDGMVADNVIRFDTRELQTLVGKPLPWR